ncbi:MAG: elongation factor P [Myxococcales bacterium]|nr:elongation factor P [Myxococcales bacterium]MCB9708240.1 elongation factor P [Myxococcales bacterium]
MYDTSDIRKGLKVQIDGVPYTVVDFQFVKPGKGQPFTRTKLRNMLSGTVMERTYKSGEKLEKADMEERQMQYLYPEGEHFVFMDTGTYDQLHITKEQMGDNRLYLLDGTMVDVLLFDGKPIGVTPPTFVELKVVRTDPGFKGDTATGSLKPATLETGLQVNVPLFVVEGEYLKIDTRTCAYVERTHRKQ